MLVRPGGGSRGPPPEIFGFYVSCEVDSDAIWTFLECHVQLVQNIKITYHCTHIMLQEATTSSNYDRFLFNNYDCLKFIIFVTRGLTNSNRLGCLRETGLL